MRKSVLLIASGILVFFSLAYLAYVARQDREIALDDKKIEKAFSAYKANSAMPVAKAKTPFTKARRPKTSKTSQAKDASAPPINPVRNPVARQKRTEAATVTKDAAKEADSAVASARECYDSGDFPCALERAAEGLLSHPSHIKLLRYAVSAACYVGDEGAARQHYTLLPERHRRSMQIRCRRFGIEL